MFGTRLAFIFLLCGLAAGAGAQSVFDMPRLFPQHRRTLARFMGAAQRGDLTEAEAAARAGARLFPRDANWHYNVACVCARAGRQKEALEWLGKAIDLGFTDRRQLEGDADLTTLRTLPEFQTLLERAARLAADPPKNPTLDKAFAQTVAAGTEAVVDATDTQWDWNPVTGGYMTTLLRVLPTREAKTGEYAGPHAETVRPMLDPKAYAGVLYVNRDEDVCAVRHERFPLLTPVVYGDDAQKAGAHRGTANGLFSTGLAPLPTVGNSSLAIGRPPFWRSLPRGISTDAAAMAVAFRLAMANQLYVYDATPDLNRRFKGDLLTSNNPALILSADLTGKKPDPKAAQRDLTELLLAGIGVLRPETRQEMLRRGLLVPTLQRLLRQGLKGAPDYLTPAAHPTAFDPKAIDAEAFLKAAHALAPEGLPPFFQLAVRQETMPRQYIDYFDAVGSEGIADTPLCVTRVLRGVGRTRRLTVEAAAPNEPGLTFRWFTVNGDPAKVRIRTLTPNGALATIEADWQGAYEKDGMPMRRVDVACVALRPDGTASAPAFVSLRALANERRTYDAQGRIAQVDYTAPESGFVYEDPMLSAFKNWSDHYLYDAEGRPLGWVRKRKGEPDQRFDARGRRVVSQTPDGSPKTVVNVSYLPRVAQGGDGLAAPAVELLQSDVGTPFEATP